MRRTIALLLLSVAAILFLTGCSVTEYEKAQKSDTQKRTNEGLFESPIVLKDGRTITCIVYSSGYQGGLSCDWGTK